MGDLSAHFNKAEFADRVTGECKVNPDLINALEEMRSLAGRPIRIDSGYRDPARNKEVGGVSHSQHLVGNAADIAIEGMTTYELYVLADQVEAFQHGGIGIYPGENFLHVDVRGIRARWSRVNGAYKAIHDFVETLA